MYDLTEPQSTIAALWVPQSYADGIVETIREPLLVLDHQLCILAANRAFYRTFRVSKEVTEGRRLYELGNNQWDIPRLRTLLEELIPLRSSIEDFEVEHEFPGLGWKVMRLNARQLHLPDRSTPLMLLAIDDITERKQIEMTLREGEERWRSLFEGMAEAFFVAQWIPASDNHPDDFLFLDVNPAFEKTTGLANVVGKTVRETIPGVQDDLIETYARVVSTGEPAQFEVFMPLLSNRWYEARARRVGADQFAVLFVDITTRKQAEANLRQREKEQEALVTLGDQLRDLLDVPSLTLAAMKIVGETLNVARAGYGRVDNTQQYCIIDNDWTDGSVPSLAGTYRFDDFGGDLADRLRQGEVVVVSDVSLHPTTAHESSRWNALNIRALINLPLIENGRLVALLFVQDAKPRAWSDAELTFIRKVADRTWAAADRSRAVQDLRESEEFTRGILASSPDCLKVMDLTGRLLMINRSGCAQMEIDNAADYLEQPWTNFWGEAKEDSERALAAARDGHVSRFEGYFPTAKGKQKWWEIVVTPIRDARGKPIRLLALSRDITERRLAEQERERLTRELKRSNEELSHFAHIVAHDLQAPLRGVASFAQLVQRTAKDRLAAEHNEFLGRIVDNAGQMQELVQALLKFAQVGQGQMESNVVEMEATVDAALRSLHLPIEEQQASVTRSALPAVIGDSVQLQQLLQNIISNSLKYRRPDESPKITISGVRDGSVCTFEIEDNGQGIAAEYQARIFEPLQRLHGSEIPGSGLGLAICQRIVNRHNGRIWVRSEAGSGSTFCFSLPAAP